MKICDRCKNDKNVHTRPFFGNPNAWQVNYFYGTSEQYIDLCEKCIDEFWRWMDVKSKP